MSYFFQTYSGIKFFPLEPVTWAVNIEDIAHSLSFTCRYGGHCRDFYSVAQHTIYVTEALEEEFPNSHLLHVQGFLHDMPEAYIGDMKRPLKKCLPEFSKIEERINFVIHSALNVPMPNDANKARILWADNTVLMAERRDIMNHLDVPWSITEKPWHRAIVPWNHPEDGYMNFILKWREVFNKWTKNNSLPGLCGIGMSQGVKAALTHSGSI